MILLNLTAKVQKKIHSHKFLYQKNDIPPKFYSFIPCFPRKISSVHTNLVVRVRLRRPTAGDRKKCYIFFLKVLHDFRRYICIYRFFVVLLHVFCVKPKKYKL